MLVKFQGENTGAIITFGNVAEQLLKMMGMSGKLEGAMTEEEVPGALAKLEAAVAAQKGQPAGGDDDNNDDDDNSVSIATRAVPIIDLLKEAKAKGGYVMWRPQS